MRLNPLRRLSRLLSKKSRRGDPMGSRRLIGFPLMIELLEDRTLLSTVSWIGGSGDWNDTSHWSTGALPGATDDVQINVSGITVTHFSGSGTGHTVQSLTTSTFMPAFMLYGGTLTVTGSIQDAN